LEAIKIVKAPYPYEAREKQLQGQVWVKILVSETGDVESAEVISGDPVLADAAIKAVKQWKFKPFLKNGKPAKVSTKQAFNFAFSGDVSETKAPPEDESHDSVAGTPSGSEAPKRVRVSVGVTRGLLTYKVAPVYPVEARQAHVQGTVLLQARISKEGRIVDLQLISGPKELVAAAIGAVQQWRYRPYLLMGEPVEVETQIQVNFQLR
jgi:TonB family protein